MWLDAVSFVARRSRSIASFVRVARERRRRRAEPRGVWAGLAYLRQRSCWSRATVAVGLTLRLPVPDPGCVVPGARRSSSTTRTRASPGCCSSVLGGGSGRRVAVAYTTSCEAPAAPNARVVRRSSALAGSLWVLVPARAARGRSARRWPIVRLRRLPLINAPYLRLLSIRGSRRRCSAKVLQSLITAQPARRPARLRRSPGRSFVARRAARDLRGRRRPGHESPPQLHPRRCRLGSGEALVQEAA